jgi:UDP-GlcNAc3NAcA epimerase
MKVILVVGARPQFIKVATVLHEFNQANKKYDEEIISVLVHTGQHYDFNMSELFFEELELTDPDYNLGVGSGLHGEQTGEMLEALEKVYLIEHPDIVVVFGDTNSTLAGALAAAKLHIPVTHVEAGLRSFNRRMPEEINRILTDHLSTMLFCPCEAACQNLAKEGFDNIVNDGALLSENDIKHISRQEKPAVVNVGDVMVDALQMVQDDLEVPVEFREKLSDGGYIVLTLHRAENVDDRERINSLLKAMADSSFPIIFPIHPRTKARISAFGLNSQINKFPFRLIEPLGYKEMLGVVGGASLIITDSGGLQKEAFMLGVPCITLRTETEWVETVEAGWNRLLPRPEKGFLQDALTWANNIRLLDQPKLYGDGLAGKRIALILRMMTT